MKILTIFAATLLLATPAMASQGLFCSDAGGEIDASISLGGGAGFGVLDATLDVGGQKWTTAETAGATPIVVGQAAAVDDRYYVDFADANYEGILARVRLFRAGQGDEAVISGTLEVKSIGAWPVVCGIG